ncbi:MAG TPA: ATP-binding protein, partial [Burkholderiaceae bacterium]|nr:ATP-binding protein [Burkholderiaceae bacterium]
MNTVVALAAADDAGLRAANPFPGLRPFEADDTHVFFGRDGQSTALIALLARTRFVGVVGTSGSGKSSLVRAGLLPQLEGGLMASAGPNWRIAVTTPGDAPIHHLASALCDARVLGRKGDDRLVRAAQIEAVLRRGSRGLLDATGQARLEPDENLLVVVDQFEELFRMSRLVAENGTSEAADFVALLLEAARQ